MAYLYVVYDSELKVVDVRRQEAKWLMDLVQRIGAASGYSGVSPTQPPAVPYADHAKVFAVVDEVKASTTLTAEQKAQLTKTLLTKEISDSLSFVILKPGERFDPQLFQVVSGEGPSLNERPIFVVYIDP